MDGFAVRSDDGSVSFRIVEVVAAGGAPTRGLRAGECARIMTGAMLPLGAGRVIRKELVEEMDGSITVMGPETGDNVIPRGANLRAGDIVLLPKMLSAQDVGILAASGFASVAVMNAPSVGIISTGSEIRSPGEPLGPGEIYNSNAAQLVAQLAPLRCPTRFLGVVIDQPAPLSRAIESALSSCELVLLTGGVSSRGLRFRASLPLGAWRGSPVSWRRGQTGQADSLCPTQGTLHLRPPGKPRVLVRDFRDIREAVSASLDGPGLEASRFSRPSGREGAPEGRGPHRVSPRERP